MASNYTEWHLQLVDRQTKRAIDDDSGLFVVLTAGAPDRLTVYSDAQGTSLSQPATMTNGSMRFFMDSATTSADISILTSAGKSYFLEAVTPSMHRVDVDPDRSHYTFITSWNGNTACDAVADTGFDLLAGMRVSELYVHTTVITTATAINVGISGNTSGFLALAPTSVTGFQLGNVAVISNETATLSIVASTQKRGTLLVDYGTGFSATVTAGGSRGFFSKKPYNVTANTSLVYVVKETNSGGTGKGYLYVTYELNPTQGN